MQFYVRQKVQDLLTQKAVNIQGTWLWICEQNNLELIKGVDRATKTTVPALRTACIVAQALVNLKWFGPDFCFESHPSSRTNRLLNCCARDVDIHKQLPARSI